MAPYALDIPHYVGSKRDDISKPSTPDGLILESWAQGYMIGSLVIMAAVTVANMRRGVLLHKLILIELIFGMFHGTFIFAHEPEYGWYLSVTAIFLNMSWSLHNVIAWIKTKPFLSRKWSLFYIGTVILAQPYWVVEIYANFTFFNNINDLFIHTRPYEALFRDPWWIFSTLNLFWNIHTTYHLPLLQIVTISPRFAVLLTAMTLSVCFIVVDVVSVTSSLGTSLPDGLNPFWKLAFVFKCLTDSIVLDDFKTALDRLMRFKMQKDRFGSVNGTMAATEGSFSRDDEEWETGSGNGGDSTCGRHSAGGLTKEDEKFGALSHGTSEVSSSLPTAARQGSVDPLSEEMMDEEEFEKREKYAEKDMDHVQAAPGQLQQRPSGSSGFGGGSGGLGGDISFFDALNEGDDLEKKATRDQERTSDEKTGASAEHVEHWEEMELGDFETSSHGSSDGTRKGAG